MRTSSFTIDLSPVRGPRTVALATGSAYDRHGGRTGTGTIPRLPASAGPAAPRPSAAGQARPVGRGPAGPAASLPGIEPVPRPERRRAGRLAAADPRSLPGQRGTRF